MRRIERALIAAVGAACVAMLLAGTAAAQSYYWHEGSPNPPKASYVFRYTYNQPCQTLHKYLTTNLTPGADTVMHLTVAGNEVAWNDNFGSGSQITYWAGCSSGTQQVTVWVRAVSNASGGDPDLGYTYTFRHERVTSPAITIYTKTNVKLGGWLLAPGGTLNTAANDTVETVLTNNGAGATMLLRFYWDTSQTPYHYRLHAWNEFSGVGVGSKLGGTSYGNELWVVATPTEATREGAIRVVRNDVYYGDVDGDGLGDYLELEACTCLGPSYWWPFYCESSGSTYVCNATATESPRDTDGDGLSDKLELIGQDASGNGAALYMPWWGANPRRRDIFIEVDRTQTGTWMSEATAIAAARPYAELQIVNPDGSTGVSTHFDIGGAGCSNEDGSSEPPIGGGFNHQDVDGITKFCGDFGGADIASYVPEPVNCAQDISMMAVNRHRVFRWMLRHSAWNGTVNGTGPRCAYIGNDVDAIAVVAHELGHQIGLHHNGPSENMNQTPTYQSLMNYAYSDRYYTWVGGVLTNQPGFSHGTLASWPIDPNSLSETTDFGGSAPLDFLLHPVSAYDFDVDPSYPRRIDWNRDGWFDPSVRAHVVGPPNKRNFGGHEMPTQFNQQNLSGLLTETSVGAAYSPGSGYSYVVATSLTSRKFQYRRRTLSGSWTNWALLQQSPVFASTSSPAIAVHQVAGVDKLFVVGGTTGGLLMYARFDVNANLELEQWTQLPVPQGVEFLQVSMASSGGRLYVVATDVTTGLVWFGWFDGAVWNSGGFRPAETPEASVWSVDSRDEPQVAVTPGIAGGPDGRLYMFVRNPVEDLRPGDDKVELYVYDPIQDAWSVDDSQRPGSTDTKCSGPLGRISTIYRPHVTAAGGALSNNNGALWTWYSTTCDDGIVDPEIKFETFYRWTWLRLNATVQDFNRGKWHRMHLGSGSCNDLYLSSVQRGVALIDHPANIQALVAHYPRQSCPGGVWWVPFADGLKTPPEPPRDFDDRTFIRNNLCISLHGDCTKCAAPNVQCGPYSPSGDALCYDSPDYVE